MEQTRLTQFGTLFGSPVDTLRLMREVMGITEETLITDEVEGWKLNNSSEKKMNEGKWFRAKMWLPVRFHNFCWAMMKCNFDLAKAVKFAKENLFNDDAARSPVFLPDLLAVKAGRDLSRKHSDLSYNQVLLGYDDLERAGGGNRILTLN